MPRGGKREGAGRKAQGVTRKVSLTLDPEEWAQIEASGLTVAAFLKQHMGGQPSEADRQPVGYLRRHVEERWHIYLNNSETEHAPEAVESAKAAMFRIMFPAGADAAHVRTKEQYECPFTGKRFGSMDALVKAAIPHLISAHEHDIQRRREKAERETAISESERHRQQLIAEGKFPKLGR